MANVESNGVGDGVAIATNVSSEGRTAAAAPAVERIRIESGRGMIRKRRQAFAIRVGEDVSRLNTSNCILAQYGRLPRDLEQFLL